MFDVLYSEGKSHVAKTLMERKERLAAIVNPSPVIAPTVYVDGQGIRLKKYTEEQGWEGIATQKLSVLFFTVERLDEDKEF
ncbi:hypothetical protein NZD89_20745 [Alicyclobacillus fastidiosus]|uniref:Uncharacterized protein n=1 Tax=Alicyclobacillus fastidiosus TaxID=392011 RepID=A0ABY6ZD82_9BACL|nr:hypothetical protein [Alicyclobacillus fastidiosus]WAH40705.1 hypothetical protein NZD89_20745 [Alicyclobacillus fastidiosus]GMA62177.1 hypothetical protein GCM10025859_26170 [Alicyclobacillus fastidiosus]